MQHVPKAGAVRSDINVTPLVDVVLVLLIIFMVVTPMLQKGPAVKLPMTSSPSKKPDEKSQILVAVAQGGDIWIDTARMTEAEFDQRIRETRERQSGSSVVVKGDARLEYGVVKRIMMKVKEAGFGGVGLIVEKRQS